MSSQNKAIKVLIAASGSGGHLFPALFIAEALQKLNPRVTVEFIGSGRPLEAKLVDARGFRRHEVRITGIKGFGVFGAIRALISYPRGLLTVWKLISDAKPDLVIGVGGYVSVLPVLVAAARGIPTWIHEAEIHPGAANALLAHVASRISVAWPNASLTGSRVVFTGHPIRRELAEGKARGIAHQIRKNVLVLGGSQGAQAIDDAFVQIAPALQKQGISLWHQCREQNSARLSAEYEKISYPVKVSSFIDDMVAALEWADIVVSRSGAGSVAELGAFNMPSILVPLPNSIKNHQVFNARALESAGKAIVVEQGDQFEARLLGAIEMMLLPEHYKRFVSASGGERSRTAAQMIAEGCLALVKT